MLELNDVHSRLNRTRVARVVRPRDEGEVCEFVRGAREPFSVMGGRHAMGGQAFLSDGTVLDTTGLVGGARLDRERGLLTIGAGAMWPEVIAATGGSGWGIRQKQTGVDDVTLGGTLGCNGHGRVLTAGPIVDDVESFRLVTPGGEVVECSRERERELFGAVIGGYGLLGIVTEVTLRLVRRRKMRRLVDVLDLDDAMNAVYRRVAEGCEYGDFQYAIDPDGDGFLKRGVMACYRAVGDEVAPDGEGADLPREKWLELLELAHRDKSRAFGLFAQHYLSTHGRVYFADTMQLATYIPEYAEFLAERRGRARGEGGGGAGGGAGADESLMITELDVPPERLTEFMARARELLRSLGVEDLYGTIRAIQHDTTTMLPWASADYACVIFNLRTVHSEAGVARTRAAACGLIDAALDLGGNFFLTYHPWASGAQLERAYPRLQEFFALKDRVDPRGRLRSDWECAVRAALGERAG
jgi:FAD/FMN-containing dehydrogenase